MRHRLQWVTLSVVCIAAMALANCAPRLVEVPVTVPPQTVVVTATPTPAPSEDPSSPLPSPEPKKTVTICTVGEPDTLYLYGGSSESATEHVMAALYDGPINYVDYVHRPVILDQLPTLDNGDVFTRAVRVTAGDRVVDATGDVVVLEDGVEVWPAGCADETCAVTFEADADEDEEPVRMERTVVTFSLVEGLTWSDGGPLTAEDSVFGFEVASDPATPAKHELTTHTASYEAVREGRLRWAGLPGFVPDDYAELFFPPLPRHQLEAYDPDRLTGLEETRIAPLTWGPFAVTEWVPGDHITLARNPHYYRASEGLPALDEITFRFAMDAPEMATKLLAEECDIAPHHAGFQQLLPILAEAEQEGLVQVASAAGETWEQLDFGIDPIFTYRRPDFFEPVEVRQAIAHCIDRQTILDEVTYGYGKLSDTYLPPTHPLYLEAEIARWPYDPAAGQALLEEVGWLDQDEDGVREASGVPGVISGTSFEVMLFFSSSGASSHDIARIVKANLAECGIRVDLEGVSPWRLFADGPEGPFFGRQFDMVELTSRYTIDTACQPYLSSEIPQRFEWTGSNASGYSNPEYDAACESALQAHRSSRAYRMHQREALRIFSEDLPAISLFTWPRLALTRPRVTNFVVDSSSPSELWCIEQVDVE